MEFPHKKKNKSRKNKQNHVGLHAQNEFYSFDLLGGKNKQNKNKSKAHPSWWYRLPATAVFLNQVEKWIIICLVIIIFFFFIFTLTDGLRASGDFALATPCAGRFLVIEWVSSSSFPLSCLPDRNLKSSARKIHKLAWACPVWRRLFQHHEVFIASSHLPLATRFFPPNCPASPFLFSLISSTEFVIVLQWSFSLISRDKKNK